MRDQGIHSGESRSVTRDYRKSERDCWVLARLLRRKSRYKDCEKEKTVMSRWREESRSKRTVRKVGLLEEEGCWKESAGRERGLLGEGG